MKLIKLVMAVLGLIFGVMLFFWLFGLVTSLLWYGFVLAVIGAATLLTGRLGTYHLLRVESGRLELLTAITAAPLNHPYRVKACAAPYSWEK